MCKCSGQCGCNITSTTKGEKGDASPEATLGYKVYKALLNQNGTDAPVATILENTLGEIPVWSYISIGKYRLLGSTNIFTMTKTAIYLTGVNNLSYTLINYLKAADDEIQITTYNAVSSALSDDLLSENTTILIEVYP